MEAGVIAQALCGPPVQVVWTREDDLRHDFYRRCALHRLEAALGPDGYPVAMRDRFCTPAIDASGGKRGTFGAGESGGVGTTCTGCLTDRPSTCCSTPACRAAGGAR